MSSIKETVATTLNNSVAQVKAFLNTVTARELVLVCIMVFSCTLSYLLGALDMAHNYKVQLDQQQTLQKAESEKVKYIIIDKGNNTQYVKETNGGHY